MYIPLQWIELLAPVFPAPYKNRSTAGKLQVSSPSDSQSTKRHFTPWAGRFRNAFSTVLSGNDARFTRANSQIFATIQCAESMQKIVHRKISTN